MGQLWQGLQELLAGVLSFFYDLVPNYGLGIIFLTIIINLLLFPAACLFAVCLNANGIDGLLQPFRVAQLETLHLIQEWRAILNHCRHRHSIASFKEVVCEPGVAIHI